MSEGSIRDALGRELPLAPPARRVVSLVPSETESVVRLAGVARLVGRTRYCEVDGVESVPLVGGTKDTDLEAIRALAPDLVLANQEENAKKLVLRLIDDGLRVHVSFPCDVEGSRTYVEALARLLGVAAPDPDPRSWRPTRPLRVLVLIWRDPWMTQDGRTYAGDVLRTLGATNAFEARARRYPLAADLGRADARPADGRDTRYPRLSDDELRDAAPDLVLLPDEPYAFQDADAEALRALGVAAPIRFVSGKDLFWYGTRTPDALARLARVLGS